MIVFRLSKKAYKNKLSGRGAEIHGGRWNSKGTSILYTSESRALCTTEIAVHVPLGIIAKDYFLQTIKLPKTKILEFNPNGLPSKWNSNPPIPQTKKIGDQFVKDNEFLVLKIPSAVIQDEYNYLINPNHQWFQKIELINIVEFKFDKRLFH